MYFLKMKLLLMVSHRAPVWALYFFSCLLMTCPCIVILYVIGKSLETIERNLQVALDCLAKWCKCNGMLINTTKTKTMLIKTHRKRKSLTNDQLSLHLNNDELNMIMNDKVLGIIIDNNLTWTQHVDEVCKRLQQTCGFYLESKIT